MLSRMIAACLGMALVPWLPALPTWQCFGLGALLVCLLLLVWRKSAWVVLAGLFGAAYSTFICMQSVQALLPSELDNHTLTIEGQIAGLVESSQQFGKRQQRFRFDVDRVIGDSTLRPRTLLLRWQRELPLIPGQQWQLSVRLKRPRGLSNPGGFDFERWLVSEGIDATGKVDGGADNRQIARSYGLAFWRWKTVEGLAASCGHFGQYPLIAALLLGDKRGISNAQWEVFKDTGTIHLFVVSGLHVGIVAFLAYRILSLLFQWLPGRNTVALCAGTIVVTAVFAALTGWGLPAQRALIMSAAMLVIVHAGREVRAVVVFAAAALLCLLMNPLAVLGVSIWLSFGAVLILLLITIGTGQIRSSRMLGLRTLGAIFSGFRAR